MSKIAYIFPGQGAQKCGMGQDFYDTDSDSKAVYDRASELTGIDMKKLCFEEGDELNLTEYTQVAMVTTGIAMLQAIRKTGLTADVCAGLSLGEYEALYQSGVLSEDDAIRTVRERGLLMQHEVPVGQGGMSAVLKMDAAAIEECIKDIDGVWIANYNCPGQIVISGSMDGIAAATDKLKAAGAGRVMPLNVSAPFHSGMMVGAGQKLDKTLGEITINKPAIPYVANYTAQAVYDAEPIRDLLVQQVSGSVRFEQSIRTMVDMGVDTFVEIGPGKTLTGFVKKTCADVAAYSIQTVEDMQAVAAQIL